MRPGQLALSRGLLPPSAARGSCSLLEEGTETSGSSLFRHLETRAGLAKHSGEWGTVWGQRRASKPTSGVAQSTCQHTCPLDFRALGQKPGNRG